MRLAFLLIRFTDKFTQYCSLPSCHNPHNICTPLASYFKTPRVAAPQYPNLPHLQRDHSLQSADES
jgi:hypothetical protein